MGLAQSHNKGDASSSPFGGLVRRTDLESVKQLESGRSAAW